MKLLQPCTKQTKYIYGANMRSADTHLRLSYVNAIMQAYTLRYIFQHICDKNVTDENLFL